MCARARHPQIVFVSKYAALGLQPSRETRNMIAIAYKTVVGRLRSALQVLLHSSHPDVEVQEELATMRAQVRSHAAYVFACPYQSCCTAAARLAVVATG